MNTERMWSLIRKDWKETIRNGQAIAPLLLVPLILVVAVPALLLAFPNMQEMRVAINGMDQFVQNIPAGAIPPDIPEQYGALYAILVYFFAPIFLIIPVIAAMVIGSVSFAGEKERKTLEGLLYSPLSAREFLLSKILVSFIPALALTLVAFAMFALVVNVMGAGVFGQAILPTPAWLVLALLLVPGISLLVVIVVVGVSMRSKTVQNAQAAAAVFVLPLVGMVIAQTVGVVLFDTSLSWIATGIVWALNAVSIVMVVGRFDREQLVLRL